MRVPPALTILLVVTLLGGYAWWARGRSVAGDLDRLFYHQFVARNRANTHPISRRTLDSEMRRLLASDPPEAEPLAAGALRGAVTDALRIRFLVDGLDDRPLATTVRAYAERQAYTEFALTLEDARLGSIDALLLVPRDGRGVHPGIVGLHGHREKAPDFIRRHLGADLARAGYVVIAPTMRAMACDRAEARISTYLLRRGFTLMGVRVYETLVAAKYLRSLQTVEPDHLAIVGHSGGSSTANLVLRVTSRFAAAVTDHEVDYRDLCDGLVHCETAPALFPLAGSVNDDATLPIPRLHVPYGLRGAQTRQRVLAFLDEQLHGPRRASDQARHTAPAEGRPHPGGPPASDRGQACRIRAGAVTAFHPLGRAGAPTYAASA